MHYHDVIKTMIIVTALLTIVKVTLANFCSAKNMRGKHLCFQKCLQSASSKNV